MKLLTQEWVDKAEGDCKVAADQWQTASPVFDAICFHAQQCVEKYLKAWLVEHEVDFPRIHDLELLARLCAPSLPDMGDLMDGLLFLTSFAVEIRYPGASAEKEDAQKCWHAARQIRSLLRSRLGLE